MHLVSPAHPVPRSRMPVVPRDSEFFYQLFEHCFEYLDAARYAQGVVVVPLFPNGDLLAVRLPSRTSQCFSVEFPFGSPKPSSCPRANALTELAGTPTFDWSPRAVLRLGAVSWQEGGSPLDVFLVAVPDDAAPDARDSEGVNHPLRISAPEFKGMVARGEVTAGHTLAAYALLLTRQALQGPGAAPVLDRRRPQKHLTRVCP